MLNGIHHTTALASDPQQNVDFYINVLGLRLVKQTVNFDAPDVYHLYYGDETGTPGTILTFFPFVHAARGKRGVGEISSVAFAVPEPSRGYWIHRLSRFGIRFEGPFSRYGQEVISFEDPDGMVVDLVFNRSALEHRAWSGSPVPQEHSVQRLHGATLLLANREKTERIILDQLGFRYVGHENGRFRYVTGSATSEALIDLVVNPDLPPARQSAGSVHHIAWRVADGEAQRQWRTVIADAKLHVTEVLDRQYFQSIYFREPGGVLFEIATDIPGFIVDESVENLGSQLKLPPWLEPERTKIERILPAIDIRRKEVIHP